MVIIMTKNKKETSVKNILKKKINSETLSFLMIGYIIFIVAIFLSYNAGYNAGITQTTSLFAKNVEILYHFIPNNLNGTNNLSPYNCTIGISSGNNGSIIYYLNTRLNGNVTFNEYNCLGVYFSIKVNN